MAQRGGKNVTSDWVSGNLYFFDADLARSTTSDILIMTQSALTVGGTGQDLDFGWYGTPSLSAVIDCGAATYTITGLAITSTGALTISATTEATTNATGALKVSGGVGIAKSIIWGTKGTHYELRSDGSTANTAGTGITVADDDRVFDLYTDDNSAGGAAATSLTSMQVRQLMLDGPFEGEQYVIVGKQKYVGCSLSSYSAGVFGTLEYATSLSVTGYQSGLTGQVGGAGTLVINDFLIGVNSRINIASSWTGSGKAVAFHAMTVNTQVWDVLLYSTAASFKQGILIPGGTIPYASTAGTVISVGTSGTPLVNDTASQKWMSFYTDTGASSGVAVGYYHRNYVTGAGGGYCGCRIYADVAVVGSSGASAIQATVGTGESTTAYSVTGLGTAVYAQVGLANATSVGGTFAVINAEVYSWGTNSDPANLALSIIRVSNGGDATGADDVDTDCYLLDFSGSNWTPGSGSMLDTTASSAQGDATIKIKWSDGTSKYLLVADDPN